MGFDQPLRQQRPFSGCTLQQASSSTWGVWLTLTFLSCNSPVFEAAVPEPAVHSDLLTGNEVFKKDDFRVLCVQEHGTNCFHQAGANPRGRGLPGPKFFMQQEAALLNHEAQIVLHKWFGTIRDGVRVSWRSFASYPNWETARSYLEGKHGSVNELSKMENPASPIWTSTAKTGSPSSVSQ